MRFFLFFEISCTRLRCCLCFEYAELETYLLLACSRRSDSGNLLLVKPHFVCKYGLFYCARLILVFLPIYLKWIPGSEPFWTDYSSWSDFTTRLLLKPQLPSVNIMIIFHFLPSFPFENSGEKTANWTKIQTGWNYNWKNIFCISKGKSSVVLI